MSENNLAECLKESNPWGETLYHNICSGEVTIVPWGVSNYVIHLGFIFLTIVLVFAIVFAILVAITVFFEI